MKAKNPPVARPADAFDSYYAAREQERIRRGELAPEHIGRLAAREQIRREREEMAAIERSWRAS